MRLNGNFKRWLGPEDSSLVNGSAHSWLDELLGCVRLLLI